ncbi:hypothetical protein [Ralstonia solanacearum]|uniref:hypothetical protein n=1 Tax=Ralstonia solanacearum TaxID=305 RepID=UPI003D2A4011
MIGMEWPARPESTAMSGTYYYVVRILIGNRRDAMLRVMHASSSHPLAAEANAHRLFPGNGKSSAVSRQRISSTSACNESASVLSDPRLQRIARKTRVIAAAFRHLSCVSRSSGSPNPARRLVESVSVRTETSRESILKKIKIRGPG